MISLLITLLLSGMGIVCKSRMKASDFWMHRWGGILMNGTFGMSICLTT
ncbi:hypothetical protein AA0116_g10793 [Alternaria tenuissima]|nr:hypothetical protein AA0116_g10793 [Alternaria tenuissima]